MKTSIIEFLSDLKEEIIVVIGNIAVYFTIFVWEHFIPQDFPINISLKDYFTSDRLSGIASFFAITIGVYIAVITILATSEISISKDLLARKLDKRIINVVIVGMIENFVAAGISIFIPLNKISRRIILAFIVLSIISFIKFIILLIRIFKGNMNQMAKSIDETERYNNDLLTYVQEISRYCRKNRDK